MPALLTSMGNAHVVQLSDCFSYITSSPPPVVEGRASVRVSSLALERGYFPWFGMVLRRWTNESQTQWRHAESAICWRPQFCVEFDHERGSLELPKGRTRGTYRTGACASDRSPFGTARWALWEKTGVWVAWRAAGTYTWHSDRGQILPLGPSLEYPRENAWVCTDLAPEDTLGEAGHRRMWLTMAEFEMTSDRLDHLRVLAESSEVRFFSGPDHFDSGPNLILGHHRLIRFSTAASDGSSMAGDDPSSSGLFYGGFLRSEQ